MGVVRTNCLKRKGRLLRIRRMQLGYCPARSRPRFPPVQKTAGDAGTTAGGKDRSCETDAWWLVGGLIFIVWYVPYSPRSIILVTESNVLLNR